MTTKPKKLTGMAAFAASPPAAAPVPASPTRGPATGQAMIEASHRFLPGDHRRITDFAADLRAEWGRKVSIQELVERGLSLLLEQRGLPPLQAVVDRDRPKGD